MVFFSPPKSRKECSSQLSGWISSWGGRSWSPDSSGSMRRWLGLLHSGPWHDSRSFPKPRWWLMSAPRQLPAWALCKETHPKETFALWYIYYVPSILISFKTITSHSKPNLIYVSQLDNAIHNNKIKHVHDQWTQDVVKVYPESDRLSANRNFLTPDTPLGHPSLPFTQMLKFSHDSQV